MKALLLTLALCVGFSVAIAQTNDVRSEIVILANQIKNLAYRNDLSPTQLMAVRDGLRNVLDNANSNTPSPGRLICARAANGLFYPTSPQTGTIVGSNGYYAGSSDLQSCRNGLPGSNELLGCFRQNNGLYYPTNPDSGAVVGSDSYYAGYSSVSECKSVVPKYGDTLACYRQNNGLFYPSNATTGKIVGSDSYYAGYGNLHDCKAVINQ